MHARSPGWDPRSVDGLVVVLVGVAGIVGLIVPQEQPAAPLALALPPVLAQAGALWWRRRRPLLVLVVTLVALLVAQAVGDVNAASFLGPHAAAYAVAVYADRTRALTGVVVVVAAAAIDGAVVTWLTDLPYGPVLLSPTGAFVLIAWGIGRYVQVRRAYLDAVLAYTHQLEEGRDEHMQRAIREERRRIARDLHDQVAHHLGVISLQTSAAQRWLGRDPHRAATALASAEQASRTALETMPAILQALRSDDRDAARVPQPTLADIDQLIDQLRAAGMVIEREIHGEPRPLHPTVELTAYRVIQESLTNVTKHAGRAGVTVRLRYGAGRFEVEVEDDGHGPPAAPGDGAELGLVGMRERVQLLDGELVTGPREGGGFRVRASLPTARPAGPS